MLHTIAHYGSYTAYGFTAICALILLFMAASVTDATRDAERGLPGDGLVWQVPAVFVGLGAFWGLVGYGLSLL